MDKNIKGICNGGKSYLINPNLLFGDGETDLTPVNIEDLNIYVELTTSKKSRSIIDVDSTGGNVDSSTAAKKIVSFIGGSVTGVDEKGEPDKYSLTTSYTDLTTVFDSKATKASGKFEQNADTEKFGIKSIDINFNSSYTPLIKIEFVDVRGASLFNTGNPPNSEYSSFFDLPYPIFNLKVKGYYGKPVKYCLHLVKWNAKFNAQTGNFEITADFIGYTYAMLTDMLLGYLRAITKTTRGFKKFEKIKSEMVDGSKLITINQLLTKIINVNENVLKLQNNDVDVKKLAANKELQNSLKSIEELVKSSIDDLSQNDSSESNYTVLSKDDIYGIKYNKNKFDSNNISIKNTKKLITTEIENINKELKGVNTLNSDKFTDVRIYNTFSYNSIMTGNTENNTSQLAFRIAMDYDEFEFNDFKETVKGLNTNSIKDVVISIYDYSNVFKEIDELRKILLSNEETIKESVAVKVENTFIDDLGFEPSIKNIFRIFTVHAEIFMECLEDVSREASESEPRQTDLSGLVKDLDLTQNDKDIFNIYPWPLFRKASNIVSKSKTYEEAWLGDEPSITPQNIPELMFVEDLLKGLLEVAKEDNENQSRNLTPDVIINSWYPVNTLDTPLFGIVENPYKTKVIGDNPNKLNPLKLMGLRLFTFFGASNRHTETIQRTTMGSLEANTMYEGIINKDVRNAMFDINKDTDILVSEIIGVFLSGKTDNHIISIKPTPTTNRSIMHYDTVTDNYFYNYISDSVIPNNGDKSIPFNGNFDGAEFYPTTTSNLPISNSDLKNNSDSNGYVFVSTKELEDNGSTMLKIFTEIEYEKNAKSLVPNYVNQSEIIQKMVDDLNSAGTNMVDIGKLYSTPISGKDAEVTIQGFNILGDDTSKFSTTTIKYVDVSNIGGNSGELFNGTTDGTTSAVADNNNRALVKTIFYVDQINRFGATSFASINIDRESEFKSPFKRNGAEWYPLRHAGVKYVSSNTNTIATPDIGNNRLLSTSDDIYVPYVDICVSNNIVDEDKAFSLFGSKWYFEQRQSSSPVTSRAFLFLHTLPWNGLYTDDVNNALNSGYEAGIFENNEGNTIGNLFNRKASFINAPYLWTAFIGGLLWRLNTDDIIYEDGFDDINGKVATSEGGSGTKDPIIWGELLNPTDTEYNYTYPPTFELENDGSNYNIDSDVFPKRNEYFTNYTATAPLTLDTSIDDLITTSIRGYKKIDNILLKLPKQIKLEFIKMFFKFVKSTEWVQIRKTFEIQTPSWDNPNNKDTIKYNNDGTNDGVWVNGSNNWDNKWIVSSNITSDTNSNGTSSLTWSNTASPVGNYVGINGIRKDIAEDFRNFSNLDSLTPITNIGNLDGSSGVISPNAANSFNSDNVKEYNYNLAHKPTEDSANKILVNLIKKGVWIANNSYKPWVTTKFSVGTSDFYDDSEQEKFISEFNVKSSELKEYLTGFISEWKRLIALKPEKTEEELLKQQVFNTMDSNLIRLNIYRHCKSIYDKWIAGSSGNIMASCGTSSNEQPSVTKSIKDNDRNGSSVRLIDSFRFTNRAFNDIGDDYLLNPKIITDSVLGNPNQSFYSLISRVLADNNFNFIALPAYIDFKNETEMESLFKPILYNNDTVDNSVSGPTFMCVYAGQSSNKLDLGNGSSFPNDGFDFKCDKDGNLDMSDDGIPKDFSKESKDNEHNVVAFAVNYGQQNQNIFTDVKLDQQEFSETDESLQITNDIANNGSQSSRTQAGQNLWNVYQMRSYSSEITALGNVMIQPMMYYQLNNIPMFHGAYMIINTTHKITPNHMKTTFKGVRTRYIDTPLIDSDSLYMSMLGTLSDVEGLSYNIDLINKINGLNTQIVSEQGKYVIYDVKTSDGLVYQETNPNGKGDSYAMTEVGKFMEALAIKWYGNNKDLVNSDKLYINSFGNYGGGANKKHSDTSLHYVGRAVDFRPMMKTKVLENWYVGQTNYSTEKNIELFQMAIDMSNSNKYGVKLNNMILNDDTLISYFKGNLNIDGGELVIKAPEHDNHIHFEFDLPTEVSKSTEDDKLNERLTSSETKGQISVESVIKPNYSTIINALGKI